MANRITCYPITNNAIATPYNLFRFHKLFNIQPNGEVSYLYYGDVDVCLDLYGQDYDRRIGIFKYTIKVQAFSRFPFSANGIKVSCNGRVIYQTDKTIHFMDNKQLLAEGFIEFPAEEDGSFNFEPLYFTTRIGNSTQEVSYFPYNNSPHTPYKIDLPLRAEPFVLPTGDWRIVTDNRPSNAMQDEDIFIYKRYYVNETVDAPFQLAIPWVPENTTKLKVYIRDGYFKSAPEGSSEFIVWESDYVNNPRAGETYDINLTFPLESRLKIYDVVRRQGYSNRMVDAAMCVMFIDESGEETIYENIINFSIYVESTTPIVKGDVYDINPITTALTGDDRVIVRYASHAYAEIDAQATVADIVETGITNGGETAYNVKNYTFMSPQYPTFEFYALDAAKLFGYYEVVTPFIEYIVPTAKVSCSNITGEGEVNFSVSGNIFVGSFGAQENDIKVYYRYKLKGSETVYCDWVEMPDIAVDAGTYQYVVESNLSGLDYTRTYIFQAKVVDKVQERLSVEFEAIARPIFDWSANDFNFNVPVKIMGAPVLTGESDLDAGNTVLWEGTLMMTATDRVDLAQPISEQKTGIVLVFEAIGINTAFTTHFVPKVMLNYYNGKTQSFFMTSDAKVGKAYVGAKELYINDTYIKGHANNQTYCEVNSDYSTSQIKHQNTIFNLVAVIGV
jgi:hypothetical protein